jgi:hypothetical protein
MQFVHIAGGFAEFKPCIPTATCAVVTENRIDVSAAVPILNVRLGISSQATIVRTPDPIVQPILSQAYQMDPFSLLGRLYAGTGPMDGCAQTLTCSGYFHYFDANNPATSLTHAFPNAKTASGIGDFVVRLKGTILGGKDCRCRTF